MKNWFFAPKPSKEVEKLFYEAHQAWEKRTVRYLPAEISLAELAHFAKNEFPGAKEEDLQIRSSAWHWGPDYGNHVHALVWAPPGEVAPPDSLYVFAAKK